MPDTHTDQLPDADLDRIERSIDIDASAERVFDLVSRPGWWINQGDVDPEPRLTYDGDVAVLRDDAFGTFRIEPVRSDRPNHVSCRWLDREDPSVGTVVEFWITERDGGVTLRVVESGFTQLGNAHDQVVKHVEENTEGWETELDAARRFVTDEPATDEQATDEQATDEQG